MGAQCGRDRCTVPQKIDWFQDDDRKDEPIPFNEHLGPLMQYGALTNGSKGTIARAATASELILQEKQTTLSIPKLQITQAPTTPMGSLSSFAAMDIGFDSGSTKASKSRTNLELPTATLSLASASTCASTISNLPTLTTSSSPILKTSSSGTMKFISEPGEALHRFRRTSKQVTTAVRLTKLLQQSRVDVPPIKCAISLKSLNEFAEVARDRLRPEYWKATFRNVVEAIIRPQCDMSGEAYSVHVNKNKAVPGQIFVCHCWDDLFDDFVKNVNSAVRDTSRTLWISAFALLQTRRRSQLTRVFDSPFAAAVKNASGMLIVRSKEVNVLSRTWPIWEMNLAGKFDIGSRKDGICLAGPSFGPGLSVDSRNATAFISDDKFAIDAAMMEDGGYDVVNSSVANVLRGAKSGSFSR